MYKEQESIFYYLTVTNEPYPMPAMPQGAEEGILKGMYLLARAENQQSHLRAQLLGSGAILREALKAQKMLAENYDVAADVWSVTGYKELYQDGHSCDRWNMLHPSEEPRVPYVTHCFRNAPGALVAASDYVRALPDSICRWMPRPLVSLGTDGFGRSDTRAALRDFFEVDARFITLATLNELAREKVVKPAVVQKAIQDLEINPAKVNPIIS
jgi:pyruvate dehydrogenase E1 component